MLYSYSVSGNTIEINAKKGLSSNLIWSIHERLALKYMLYECFCTRENNFQYNPVLTIKMKRLFPKYIHIFELHEMYVNREIYTEEEMLEYHQELAPELQYDNFKNLFDMEWIDEMDYFVVRKDDELWRKGFYEALCGIKSKKNY